MTKLHIDDLTQELFLRALDLPRRSDTNGISNSISTKGFVILDYKGIEYPFGENIENVKALCLSGKVILGSRLSHRYDSLTGTYSPTQSQERFLMPKSSRIPGEAINKLLAEPHRVHRHVFETGTTGTEKLHEALKNYVESGYEITQAQLWLVTSKMPYSQKDQLPDSTLTMTRERLHQSETYTFYDGSPVAKKKEIELVSEPGVTLRLGNSVTAEDSEKLKTWYDSLTANTG